MNLDELNNLEEKELVDIFEQCCSARRWFKLMATSTPFQSTRHLEDTARLHWSVMEQRDHLEAFDGHPKIGDPASLKAKYAATHSMASNEQSLVEQASDKTIVELADFNQRYEDKFGYIFIVCATGKTAEEMLALVKTRLHNPPEQEIQIAAGEQLKILLIRIQKLLA
ncbi:MAG: 2-oxo-4-hydroxy-4-carboxy-5-ureidoimidazoline decarboxylase [Gammaproteobacteria bacterium]|nr:2-oxo-4-hydroxy-4-carboxy-5-ureidoimidazoline decarboxylase [Gammaproteobacteria bacterium]